MRSRLLLVTTGLIVIAALALIWARHHYEYVDPKQVYSETERAELIERADAGDTKASWRLYLYYSFVRYAPEQREKWLTVGAKAGDDRAIYSLAMLYANMDSQRMDLEKASRWADVLEKQDAEGARDVRRSIDRARGDQASKAKLK